MNQIQKDLIALLANQIGNNKVSLSENPEWDTILNLSEKAQILPMIYDAIKTLNLDIPEEIEKKYSQKFIKFATIDVQQEYIIQQLTMAFNENNIDYSLLKGSSIKKLYRNPLFRCMGDIDILIRAEQYSEIKKIMLKFNFFEREETVHELIWTKPPFICIELHKMLIPKYNSDFYTYYGDGWGKMIRCDGCMYKMTPEDEFIFLFTHFSKHYRDGGIGVRHLVDLKVYMDNYSLNEPYIIAELKSLHLEQFYENVVDTINVWFNGRNETTVTKIITNTIFQSGSYGNPEKFDDANALRATKQYSNIFTAKIAYIIKLIFLPLSSMKKRYPVLNKYTFLLPIFWCIRWGDVLINHNDRIKLQSKRAKKICDKDVSNYENELGAVGLNYYFRDV